MIKMEEIGPRIFYTAEAAWEFREQTGGRVFLPNPSNGEFYWFPMTMTPTPILTHRLTAGLSGWLGTGPYKCDHYPKLASGDVLRFKFTGEAWIDDIACPVDYGDCRDTHIRLPVTEFRELIDHHGDIDDEFLDNLDNSELDNIRGSEHAPRWITEWSGPFTIDFVNRENL